MSLALLKSVFQSVTPQQAPSDLKNAHASISTESKRSFPFNWDYRVCRALAKTAGTEATAATASTATTESAPAATAASSTTAGRDELLQSAISRQGLVHLKTGDETPLSDILAEVLKGANGKGVKLNNQLSIQSIKKATTYRAAAEGIPTELQSTRTRWVISVYDADLKDTFELPLTEIHLAENLPDAFNANLPFVKEAMDAHLNAIHWAYKDSVTQPTLMSLAVPEWAGLLASFEDTQMRIQSGAGYSIKDIRVAASMVYGAFTDNSNPEAAAARDLLSNMLYAMLRLDLTQPVDENAVAELSPELVKLDRIGPEGAQEDTSEDGSIGDLGISVAQSADSIRRSRCHSGPEPERREEAPRPPAAQLDDSTPLSSPRSSPRSSPSRRQ
ncbi:MAG: hypothetical protein QE278_13260 [Limnobacter sp.]|nr:hypothetical protein [Limnobacter sp.]